MEAQRRPRWTERLLLFAVKAFHSLAFVVIQSSIVFLLLQGFKGRTDCRSGLAFAIAASESAIYAGNGFRCPLTGLAEDLGAQSGSVTDIFLPRWLASNVANIYCPLFTLAILLHGRNLLRKRTAQTHDDATLLVEHD